MAAKNAIEQRLDQIEEEWFAFTGNADARLARWRLDNDGIRLVEIFLEYQTKEGTAVPDFIMRMTVPFGDPTTYADELRAFFIAEIEAAADEMREVDVDPNWPVPAQDPRYDSTGQLLLTLEAFRRFYGDLFEKLVVVLMPDSVPDARAWEWWLDQLIQRGLPDQLRFMVFDPEQAPLLDAFAERESTLVMTLSPDLDMPGAIDSLVRGVGGSAPADVFRRFFVGMNTSAQRGDVAGALALGTQAARFAKQQGWVQQVAVVHIALGSILMAAGRLKDALSAFQASGAAARESREQEDAGSEKVEVHAQMAIAGALFQAEAYDDAARAYEEAAALAEAQDPGEPILMLEARRMAAHCHDLMSRPEAAWHHLGNALIVAERIEPDQRIDTTLPFVVQSLMRLTDNEPYSPYRSVIETRLTELLGPEWPAQVMERLPA